MDAILLLQLHRRSLTLWSGCTTTYPFFVWNMEHDIVPNASALVVSELLGLPALSILPRAARRLVFIV